MTSRLSRAFLFETGEVFALFEDGVSILLLSDGLSLILFQKDGSKVRFVTQYAPKTVFQRVEPVLLFRNSCGGDPLVFERQIPQSSEKTHVPLLYAHWPRNRGVADIEADPGGFLKLKSMCGTCIVTLLPGRRWMTVEWPVFVRKTFDVKLSERGKFVHIYEHIRTVEMYPITLCPEKWQYAAKLLMAYDKSGAELKLENNVSIEGEVIDRDCSTKFPTRLSTAEGPSWECRISAEDLALLHCSQSLPHSSVCVAHWDQNASIRLSGKTSRIEILMHKDLSTICSTKDMNFFHHVFPNLLPTYRVPESLQSLLGKRVATVQPVNKSKEEIVDDNDKRISEKLYSRESCPTFHRTATVCYAVKETVEISLSIFRQSMIQKASSSSSFSPRNVTCISNEIVRERYAKGLGLFTAFKDGRIRAKFADRTLGELASSNHICTLLLASGDQHRIPIPSNTAAKYWIYLRPMIQFLQIAFLSDRKINAIRQSNATLREIIEHRRQCSNALLSAASLKDNRQSAPAEMLQGERLCEMKVLIASATAGVEGAIRDAKKAMRHIDDVLRSVGKC